MPTFGVAAEFTVTMLRNRNSKRHRAKMGDLAEKLHRFFWIAVFQFAIGWAHAAHRVDTALATFIRSATLAPAELHEKVLPALAHGSFADIVSLTMRKYANGH